MPNHISRRHALKLGLGAAVACFLPVQFRADTAWRVIVPPFMRPMISPAKITYLNETIPALYAGNQEVLFPLLDALPAVVVVNTLTDTLVQHGSTLIAPEVTGDEALTLLETQHLLTTTRFGSVATPHRGADPTNFGRLMYVKQHPITGYETPPHLLLEELIHVQQDITVMRHIIYHDDLPPRECLHGRLKGISELGAHYITDTLSGEADYVFVLDDGTHCETAQHGAELLAARLDADPVTLIRALLYDVAAYRVLDDIAMARYERHIWEMVTTWRHARDENGDSIGIAPAFVPVATDEPLLPG